MDNSSTLLPFADTIQRLTYDLVHYSALCDRICTEQLGITGSQGYTLLVIPDDESISMNDLSVKMKLASSTMTRMIDQLVQKGLVDRQPDSEDRRVVRVRLTERGGQAKMQLHETLQGFFSQVMRDIPESDRNPVIRSLERLNQAIRNTLKSCCGSDLDL
jgi:DNA-binding MarR family transcriptional regulator